jgi:hypothetical protein
MASEGEGASTPFWRDATWMTAIGGLVAALAAVGGLVIARSDSSSTSSPTTTTIAASSDAQLAMTGVSIDPVSGKIVVHGSVAPAAAHSSILAFAKQMKGNGGWQSAVAKVASDRSWETEIEVPKDALAADCCSVSVGLFSPPAAGGGGGAATASDPDNPPQSKAERVAKCVEEQGSACELLDSTATVTVTP